MKKRILRYVKHLIATLLLLSITSISIGLYFGATLHYGDHPMIYHLNNEGPYVFYDNDSLLHVSYIKGNKEDGFYVNKTQHNSRANITLKTYFQMDSTSFELALHPDFETPKAIYNDSLPILAISDIEGSYRAFRDFLIANKVINQRLEWTFGKGHLVLAGDFVDRGYSVTQVLWLIYKLEQDANKYGGFVHLIIGNHELKNLQGNYQSTADKYLAVSNILGIVQSELYSPSSFFGKWLSSKNAVESINGNLFVHGGIHPDVADTTISLNDINRMVRRNYYKPYYPHKEKTTGQLLTSTKTGICWYRGYFKDDLSQKQIDNILNTYQAKAIVVGHTLQHKVTRLYDGKVIAIDVKHPKDYQQNWPRGESEGLLIEGNQYFRVFDNGERKEI